MIDGITEETTDEPIADRPDPFAVFCDFLALITDPKAYQAAVAALDKRLVAVSNGAAALAERRRALDQYETTTRDALTAENAALTKRRGADFTERADLSKRSERIDKLRKAWSIYRENDDVQRGLRSSATSPLEKAKAAHAGFVPAGCYGEGADVAAPGSEPFANDDDDTMPTLPPEQIPRVPSPPIDTRPQRRRRISRTAARRN
jgi:hypothetical protein